MQRANFQFTGQRFFRIRGGRLAGQLRDVAYQALTTEFWGSLDAVGGPSTWRLHGAMNCGKAQPGQSAAGLARLPVGAVPAGQRAQHPAERWMRPQEIVERALAGPVGAGRAVLVTQTSEAVLRWANSTMTTNGHTTARRVAVVALEAVEGGTAAGVVSSGAPLPDAAAVDDLVAAARRAAREAGPARDVAPLPEPGVDDPAWADGPAETSIGGVRPPRRGPGRACSTARSATTASPPTSVTTVWLGTSTGRAQAVGAADGLDRAQRQDPGPRRLGVDGLLDRRLHRRRRRRARRRRHVPPRLGRRRGEPAGRAVRDAAAAVGGVGLPAHARLVDGRARGAGGPQRVRRPGRPRIGERLTDRPLTLASDPAAPGLEYAPFVAALHSGDGVSVFDNGAPARRVEWLRDGAVHELAYSRPEAAEFGTAFAPPGDNLLLTGGSAASLAEMVAGTRRGLLLTCLWYIREVDPATLLLTGLTRDGVYLVEDGEVVAEVDHNFRFNHSPLDVLRQATEVGATERTLPREWKDWFTRVAMPPIRVPDFTCRRCHRGVT